MKIRTASLALVCGLAVSSAWAQPRFVSIPGFASAVNNGGTVVVGSNGDNTFRWVRTGTSATFTLLPGGKGGTPSCSANGAFVASDIENGVDGELVNGYPAAYYLAGRWSAPTGFVNLGLFTTDRPIPGLGTPIPPGYLNTPSAISHDGNVVVGLAYVDGNPLSNFRAFRTDIAARTFISLGQLGGEGSKATCVSGDGNVVGGWDRSPTSSVNRPAVWRVNPATGVVTQFVFETPADDVGEIGGVNFDGSSVAGGSSAFPDQLVRWDWNGTTYLPTALGTLNGSVTVEGMSADGQVIVGSSGSFFFGQQAFIWTPATGMVDLLAYVTERGITGLPAGAGLTAALAVSPDGSAITVGGFFSPSGLITLTGGPACVQLTEVGAPNLTEISACEPTVILNVSVTGSGPFTYQWRRNGVDLVDGDTPHGSSISGSTGSQVFINSAKLSDTGSYDCVVANACSSITSEARVVTALPPGPYDTCATALETTGPGTVSLEMCGAYINESPASCVQGTQSADVWIRYTPTSTGDHRITTCGQDSYDTILSTYNSCGGAETACSGDFCFSLASIDRIHLTEGQPVLVRLGVGFVAPPAPVQVTFELVGPAPANDHCENAQAISASGEHPFDSTFADRDGNATCGFDTGRDVWFAFTAPARGKVTLSTCGTFFDTVLSAYTGCGGNERACNNSTFEPGCILQSVIPDLPVLAGTPILVRIAGNDQNTGGPGTLAVIFVPATGCPADFNGDSNIDPDDLSDYIACYFSEPPCQDADFNLDGNVDPDDLSDYITVYFGGC